MKVSTPLVLLAVLYMLISGCQPTTFIISKNNRAYYFGRESGVLDRMLCQSGELELILAEAHIPDNFKQDFFTYSCTPQRSKEKIVSLYQFLTPEEREELQRAFRNFDWTINYVPC